MKKILVMVVCLLNPIAYADERDPALTLQLVNYVMGVGDTKVVKEDGLFGKVKNLFGRDQSSADTSASSSSSSSGPSSSSTDRTSIGFFGTMFTGTNPFSSQGVHMSSGISLGLGVLSLLGSSSKSSPYRAVFVDKIKGDIFGKYYLKADANNATEAKGLMKADILAATKESAFKNLGLYAYCVVEGDQCAESPKNDMTEMVIKLSDHELSQDEVSAFNATYVLHVIYSDLLFSTIQPQRDELIGYTPSFETKAEDGFRLAIENRIDQAKPTFNEKAIINDPKWEQFIADIAYSKGTLVMTPNVRTFFHHGFVFTKDELVKSGAEIN